MYEIKGKAREILDALSVYFIAQPIVFSVIVLGAYRIRPHRDVDGTKILLLQRRLDGKRFATVAAVDGDGNVWGAGAFNASADFDAKKWNPV